MHIKSTYGGCFRTNIGRTHISGKATALWSLRYHESMQSVRCTPFEPKCRNLTMSCYPLSSMFKHVDLHGRPQTTRFLVYCLVDALMANHRQGRVAF
jgi:hypothetical protein